MSGTSRIVILTAGGTARDVVSIIESINNTSRQVYDVIGFLDDSAHNQGAEFFGKPVFGKLEDWKNFSADVRFVNALGSPKTFRARPERIRQLGIPARRFVSIIHPSAVVSKGTTIGAGSIIYPNVVLMSRVRVGRHVIILPNSTINHDTTIGDFSIIASGVHVGGAVKVGQCCYLGMATSVIQGISVGSRTMVGMGSVLIRSVGRDQVVVGNPARPIQKGAASV